LTAEGQRRLGSFLRAADDVTPSSVFIVAALTGQSALIAADHQPRPGVAAALRDHAEGLASVGRFVGHSQTMREGDDRPQAQAFEIRRYMRSPSGRTDAGHSAEAFAAGLSDVVESLADCARRQNDHGRWLLPAVSPGPAMWRRSAGHAQPTRSSIASRASQRPQSMTRDYRRHNRHPHSCTR